MQSAEEVQLFMFWQRWFTSKPKPKAKHKRLSMTEKASVVVKAGVKEVETGIEMGGWQGRITEVDEDNDIITIDWDSITLRALPPDYIAASEEEGLRWDQYFLSHSDVEPAPVRDTEADVKAAFNELHHQYLWADLGPEGKVIQAVLQDVDPDDELAALRAWEAHLRKALTFPFKAEVAESQDRGPLQAGDKVVVRCIAEVDDFRGIWVEIQSRYGISLFPLCDLEVIKKRSLMHDRLQAYVVWYANR